MADLIHSITSRLRRYVGDRRKALRRGPRFEVRLPFTISLLSTEAHDAGTRSHQPSLQGHTRDLSETGLTLLLPSARIRGTYLTDKANYLGISLDIPGESIGILATPVRFEQLSEKEMDYGYLLGVRIVKMQEDEREGYAAYLSTLKMKERRSRERRQVHVAALSGAEQVGAWETLTPQAVSRSFEKFLSDQKRRL